MDLHTILPALKIPSDVVGAADGLSRASGQTLEAQVLFCFGRSGCLQWVPLDLCAHGSTRGILGYAQNFRLSLTRYCFSKRDVQLRYAGSISDGLMAGPFAAGFLGRHMFRLYDMPCSMDVDALDGLHAADKAGSHADYTERVLEGGLIGEYFQSARWNRSNYGFGHGLIIARHIARFFAWKYQRPQAPVSESTRMVVYESDKVASSFLKGLRVQVTCIAYGVNDAIKQARVKAASASKSGRIGERVGLFGAAARSARTMGRLTLNPVAF